jgi:DNA replication and repair protein RecF
VKFQSLRLKNFRNYVDLSLEFPSGVVVFLGANGQGKTNLMEAFHLLLRGESFRPSTTDSLLRHEGSAVAVNALLSGKLLEKNLQHDVKMTFAEGKKALTWNGNRVSSTALAQRFPVVLFSPESLGAIKEGPEQRRALVDDVLVTHSTTSIKILKDFNLALRTRNRILKDYKRGVNSRGQALQLLESLDPVFLPLATELTVARLKALSDLHADFQRAIVDVLALPTVDISVDYLISGENAVGHSRPDILSAMHKQALERREKELESGSSLVGPQRHDVRILFSGKDSRFFCSQGQQRALILSFKMAQILYHYRAYQVHPLLLLDDVLSELDPVKRMNLVKFLKDIPAQIFITTTDLSFSPDFGDRKLSIMRIDKGTVRAD